MSMVIYITWLPVLGIFNVRADVNAGDCSLVCMHVKAKGKTESAQKLPESAWKLSLREISLALLHQRLEPVSVACQTQ